MKNVNVNTRSGFTLIELLAVVMIIAILAALITPAVFGVWQSAKIAKCKVELSQLETAMVAFETQYGVRPPSKFTLYETGGAWTTQSRAFIVRCWPQFDFGQNRDIDRDGNMGEVIELDAAECLVFFLGGTVDDYVSLNGFSKQPGNPFQRDTTPGSRVGPFYSFDFVRLVDDDGDGIHEYQDVWGAGDPIVYYDGSDRFDSAHVSHGMVELYRQPDGATHKQNSMQIVAPGADGLLGRGGQFDLNLHLTDQARQDEWDNVTNFYHGVLGR